METNAYEIEKQAMRVRMTQIIMAAAFLYLEGAAALLGVLFKIFPMGPALLRYTLFAAQVYFGAVAVTVLVLAASPTLIRYRYSNDLQRGYVFINLVSGVAFLYLSKSPASLVAKIAWLVVSSAAVYGATQALYDWILYPHDLDHIVKTAWDVTDHALAEEMFCAAYNRSAEAYNKMNAQAQAIGEQFGKRYSEPPLIRPLKPTLRPPQFPTERIHLFWCESGPAYTCEADAYCKVVERLCAAHYEVLRLMNRGLDVREKSLHEVRALVAAAEKCTDKSAAAKMAENAKKAYRPLSRPCEEEVRLQRIIRGLYHEPSLLEKALGQKKRLWPF